MTQDELDRIPETGTFGLQELVINGKVMRVPVFSDAGLLWTADDEPCAVVDSQGVRWRLGRAADGRTYKRRA